MWCRPNSMLFSILILTCGSGKVGYTVLNHWHWVKVRLGTLSLELESKEHITTDIILVIEKQYKMTVGFWNRKNCQKL